ERGTSVDGLQLERFETAGALGLGRIAEFLTGDRGLVHGAAFYDREDRKTLVVPARGAGVLLAAAGTGTSAGGARARSGGGRDGDRVDVRSELEVAPGEGIKGGLVLEEHDLAVRLTAGLKTDPQLLHRRIAHVRAVSVDVAAPMRSANHKAALADGGEHGIAVAVVEEGGALACVPKER